MVRLLVALLVACSGLNALPWRKDFMVRVRNTSDVVAKEAITSQRLAMQALVDNVEVNAITQASAEIAQWMDAFIADVEASSKEYAQEGVDVSHCVRASNSDFAALQSHINKAAAKHVKDYMEDVALTATKAAGLPAEAAGLVWQAQAEVLSSNYGAGVEAILAEADELQSHAEWNNRHIPTLIDYLRFAADSTIFAERGNSLAQLVEKYALFCMQRAAWKD